MNRLVECGAMVASRKPRKTAAPKRRRETLEQKFERIRALPPGASIPKLTRREAVYFLRRLAGANPNAPSGEEVVRILRGGDETDATCN